MTDKSSFCRQTNVRSDWKILCVQLKHPMSNWQTNWEHLTYHFLYVLYKCLVAGGIIFRLISGTITTSFWRTGRTRHLAISWNCKWPWHDGTWGWKVISTHVNLTLYQIEDMQHIFDYTPVWIFSVCFPGLVFFKIIWIKRQTNKMNTIDISVSNSLQINLK